MKTHAKKMIGILVALVLVFAMMTGCASNSSTASQPASTSSAPASEAVSSAPAASSAAQTSSASGKTFKVAFLPTDMSATFAAWLAEEMKASFKAYPDMELTVIDSKNDLQTQISAMETCVAQKYDYIVLLPIQPEAEDDLVKGYIEKGTPIMNINLDSLKVEKASSVIAKPYDLGTVVAEYAKTKLPEKANVVVMLGPSGNVDSTERRHAYQDVIFAKNPNVKILDEQIGNWYKEEGMKLMENWIQKYGDKINAVLSMNDGMALGAIEAARSAGKLKNLQFYGVDGLADAAVSIQAGELNATALQDAQIMAKEGARIVHEVLTGKNTQGFEKVQIPVTLITKDNVAQFIDRYKANGMLK